MEDEGPSEPCYGGAINMCFVGGGGGLVYVYNSFILNTLILDVAQRSPDGHLKENGQIVV